MDRKNILIVASIVINFMLCIVWMIKTSNDTLPVNGFVELQGSQGLRKFSWCKEIWRAKLTSYQEHTLGKLNSMLFGG